MARKRTPPTCLSFHLIMVTLLVSLGIPHANGSSSGNHQTQTSIVTQTEDDMDRLEFSRFCQLGFMIRENPEELEDTEECGVTEPQEFDKEEDLPMLFTLIMICAWGAFIRAVMHRLRLSIPYTVVLLISGLIFGAFSHIKTFCPQIHKYTAIARISPEHILYTFLPILIFESAHSIPVHTFYKSVSQIVIVAFPGMLVSTFFTALICWQFFSAYEWDWIVACLFGSIVSATDPVAVVAILRELGVSEQLSVLIDGESLMNDGVAILLFEIFHEYVEESRKPGHHWGTVEEILLTFFSKFCKIAIGGPIYGWICGRIVIFFLGFVYNDAAVEISATICAAYLTYWTSEHSLGVSGVMAVVMLGITLSAERTVISPESEGPLHHFWEMLGYLANTVLFFVVGVVISETAIPLIAKEDFPYLFLLYVALHVVRFSMLLVFYPILKRLGYGLTWENMMVIMWGGLRGAVGICLALQIYEDPDLCADSKLGPKILFHTAGIVFLTLVINGTTTKSLLQTLKLTEVTAGQKEEMNNAVKRALDVKWKATRSFQMSRFMIDARWEVVDIICHISNPYAAHSKDISVAGRSALRPPCPIMDNTTVCWHCNNIVENEPTVSEYREMTNDARLRVIKAMKVDYLHQFEKGILTEQAVQILLTDAEYAEDKYLIIIEAHNFHRYMKIHGFYPWLKEKIILKFGLYKEETLPDVPSAAWRYQFWYIVTRDWFEALCLFVVVFNLIPVVWDIILTYTSVDSSDQCKWTPSETKLRLGFHYTNVIFSIYYTIEVILKLLGLKFKFYCCNPWNYLDLFVLIIAYVDVYLGFLANDQEGCHNPLIQNKVKEYLNLLKSVRLVAAIRAVKLFRPAIPKLLRKIKRATNMQVFIGYDVGKGFIQSSDDVIKFIPQIVENKKVQQVIRISMERERNNCMKDLALLQDKFPGVAVALKTRHACRAVLNQMSIALNEVRDDGLLDDNEVLLLKHIFDDKIRRLAHSPTYITPTKPLALLQEEEIEKKKSGDAENPPLAPQLPPDGPAP